MVNNMKVQSVVAVGSFVAAVGLAGVLMMCAQFLTLCAAIFGLDYKIMSLIRRFDAERKS